MEQVNLKIETPESGELIIRQGHALPLIESKAFNTDGVIKCVADYAISRHSLGCLDHHSCVFAYSLQKGVIFLIEDFKTEKQGFIRGALKEDPVIEKLGINKETRFTNKSLLKTLKQSRNLFTDKDECMNLLAKLSNFSAKIETIIEDENNNRGKEKKLLEKQASTDIPEGFNIKIAPFIGEDEIEIFVEIYYECSTSGISFYLESIDLSEQSDIVKRAALKREISRIEKFGIPIIQQ